jgi:PTS system mannose-specific IIA component
MEHIIGPQKKIGIICIDPDDNMDKRRIEIEELISMVDGGKGVIILTDMFGGTPSNLAISFLEPKKIEVMAGVNLPMLIKLGSLRENSSLEKAVKSSEEAAHKYISIASEILSERMHEDNE